MKRKQLSVLAYISLVFILFYTLADAKFYSKAIARERLLAELFINYNPSTRPASKGERIEVSVNLEIQRFDFRESDGAFNIVGLLNAEWHDKKLSWNPKDYNNLTQVPVSQKLVWMPDLEMYNNAPDKFLRMHRNGFVVLNSTGNITWSDAIDLTIFCSTNMRHWPHDQHICRLSLGSWTYDGFDLDLTNNPNLTLNFDEGHVKNMQYEITKYGAEHVTVRYAGYEEPYITVEYFISFKRRAGFSIIYAPAYTVIALTLSALAMKPCRGEKIILYGLSFMLIVFQLLYFANNVGKFARRTPLIVVFYSCSLVIVTFSHLLGVFALWTSRSRYKGQNLPMCIVGLMDSPIVNYILPMQRKRFQNNSMDSNIQFEDVQLNDNSNLIKENDFHEWIHCAMFLERFAIIVFSLVFVLLVSICLG